MMVRYQMFNAKHLILIIWAGSSSGRAPRLHRGGGGFKSCPVHHIEFENRSALSSSAARDSAGSFTRNCQGFEINFQPSRRKAAV